MVVELADIEKLTNDFYSALQDHVRERAGIVLF
jgi:hypothetical protein